MKKCKTLKWKILWIQLSVFLSTFAFTITTYAEQSCGGDNSVCDISNEVYSQLERDNIFVSCIRLIGRWLYWILSTFLDYMSLAFTNLIKFDFLKDDSGKTNTLPALIAEVMKNIDTVLYAILFICFVVVVVIRLMKVENNFKTIYNAFMVVLAITLFSTIFTLMNTAKNDMVEITQSTFGGEDLKPSEQILIDNTIDFKQSVIDNKIRYLKDTNFDTKYLPYFDTEVRLLKDGEGGLKDFWYVDMTDDTLDKDDKKTLKELNGGFFGIGEESYYRFKPDWMKINLICFVMIVIYSLAIFKLGYLLWNWMSFYVFGQFAMGKGMWDVSHIGRTLKQGAMTAIGFVMLYASMYLYTIVSTGILNMDDKEVGILGKVVLLFSIGMAIISGSGFLNDFLGIDDGSGAMLRNLFVARSLSRLGGGAVRGAGNLAKTGFKGAKATGKGMYNLSKKMGDLKNEADQVNNAPETYTSMNSENKSYSVSPKLADSQGRHYEDGKSYDVTKAMKNQSFNPDQVNNAPETYTSKNGENKSYNAIKTMEKQDLKLDQIEKDTYASHESQESNQSYTFDSFKEGVSGSEHSEFDWKPSENIQSSSYNEGKPIDLIPVKETFESESITTKKQNTFEKKMNHSNVVAPSQNIRKKVFGADLVKPKIIQQEKPKPEKRTFSEMQNEFMNTVQMALQKEQKKND